MKKQLFPTSSVNPANEEIVLVSTSGVESTWTLTDVSGRLMQSGRTQQGQTTAAISVKTYPEGVYVLRILAV
ncbi:MAG: T9SS type A sorting domain-containing protein, partial [Saprospiraceae bacterium]